MKIPKRRQRPSVSHVADLHEDSMDTGKALTAVLFIALLIYAILLFVVVPALSRILGPRYGIGFADDYDRLAYSLSLGQGFRFGPELAATLMREPGYPFFLAGVFKLFGYSLEAARFANLILAGAAAFFVARLARIIGLKGLAAALAALIFLFHPGTVIAVARGGFEIFFVFVLMLFVLALYRATRTDMTKHYLLAGFLLGLVALTRSTIMLFPFVVWGYFLLAAGSVREWPKHCFRLAVLLGGMTVVISPWIARNYVVSGEIIATTTVQGVAAQTGQHICEGLPSGRGFQELDIEAAYERERLARRLGYSFEGGYYQYFYRTGDEISFNRHLMRGVVDSYREDPGFWTKCAAQNLFNFWFAGKTRQVTWMNLAVQGPFVLLALAGGYWLWRRRQGRQMALLVLVILYLFAVHVPVHAQARYSVPLIPFLSILASVGLLSVLDAVRKQASRTRGAKGVSTPS